MAILAGKSDSNANVGADLRGGPKTDRLLDFVFGPSLKGLSMVPTPEREELGFGLFVAQPKGRAASFEQPLTPDQNHL